MIHATISGFRRATGGDPFADAAFGCRATPKALAVMDTVGADWERGERRQNRHNHQVTLRALLTGEDSGLACSA